VWIGAVITLALGGAGPTDFDRTQEREANADAWNLVREWFHNRSAVARDLVWKRIFLARGLISVGVPRRPRWENVRLAADWIRFDHMGGAPRWAAEGEILGMPATCGEIAFERHSDNGRRSFTMRMFAAFTIPPGSAQRHPAVGVRRRGIPQLGERVSGQEVHLESTAVATSLVIRVSDSAEELATRELFGPQLVAALAEHPVCWDQRGDALIVWSASPAEPGPAFDALSRAAGEVARAYWSDQE
jgi:hypothetical protein